MFLSGRSRQQSYANLTSVEVYVSVSSTLKHQRCLNPCFWKFVSLHPIIELFFRALKQSLRVKTFVGTSAQALKTQLWTALIAMLLVKYLQLKSTFGWSLSNLVALLRQQLFVYRDLWAWIDNPFQPPPIPESLPELALQLAK
jgi:hypothetical protein